MQEHPHTKNKLSKEKTKFFISKYIVFFLSLSLSYCEWALSFAKIHWKVQWIVFCSLHFFFSKLHDNAQSHRRSLKISSSSFVIYILYIYIQSSKLFCNRLRWLLFSLFCYWKTEIWFSYQIASHSICDLFHSDTIQTTLHFVASLATIICIRSRYRNKMKIVHRAINTIDKIQSLYWLFSNFIASSSQWVRIVYSCCMCVSTALPFCLLHLKKEMFNCMF